METAAGSLEVKTLENAQEILDLPKSLEVVGWSLFRRLGFRASEEMAKLQFLNEKTSIYRDQLLNLTTTTIFHSHE